MVNIGVWSYVVLDTHQIWILLHSLQIETTFLKISLVNILFVCPAVYRKTGNFRVQENFAIFAKVSVFANISCRKNVVKLLFQQIHEIAQLSDSRN